MKNSDSARERLFTVTTRGRRDSVLYMVYEGAGALGDDYLLQMHLYSTPVIGVCSFFGAPGCFHILQKDM